MFFRTRDVKILTSSDGSNFEEAKCWQTNTRTEVAFEESFMFAAPRTVKAVTIAMRSPRFWGYFGINSATLIAEPGPFMLVRCVRQMLYCSLFPGALPLPNPQWNHSFGWRAVSCCRQLRHPFGTLLGSHCSWRWQGGLAARRGDLLEYSCNIIARVVLRFAARARAVRSPVWQTAPAWRLPTGKRNVCFLVVHVSCRRPNVLFLQHWWRCVHHGEV